MLEEKTIKIIREWIGGAKKIAILTHTNPDGDAIGSSLALAMALNKTGKEARVVIPDGLPDFLRWLPGIELSTTFTGTGWGMRSRHPSARCEIPKG